MGALDLMFQNGMKSTGSYALGQQLANEQQMNAAKLQEQQLANENAATMNPLNAQFKQSQIDQMQAQLPGIVGQSKSQVAQGDYDAETNAKRIASRLSDLDNQIGVNGMQQMGRDGEAALALASSLDQYPTYMHKEVAANAIKQYGGDPSSPLFAGIFSGADTDVSKKLKAVGSGMAMASSSYMQKNALQEAELKNRANIAAGNNATTIQAAKISAESRLAAAQARAQAVKHMNTDQAIAYLEMQSDRTPEEDQHLRNLKEQRLKERAAGANAVPATILGQPTPLQNAAAAAGGTPPAPASAQAKQVVRTGTLNGRKVVQYSDGSTEYAN